MIEISYVLFWTIVFLVFIAGGIVAQLIDWFVGR